MEQTQNRTEQDLTKRDLTPEQIQEHFSQYTEYFTRKESGDSNKHITTLEMQPPIHIVSNGGFRFGYMRCRHEVSKVEIITQSSVSNSRTLLNINIYKNSNTNPISYNLKSGKNIKKTGPLARRLCRKVKDAHHDNSILEFKYLDWRSPNSNRKPFG